MKPYRFILQPARCKSSCPSKLIRCICQGSIDFIHGKLLIIQITLFYILIKCLSCDWKPSFEEFVIQFKVTDRSFQKIWNCPHLKRCRDNFCPSLFIRFYLIGKIGRTDSLSIGARLFNSTRHCPGKALKNLQQIVTAILLAFSGDTFIRLPAVFLLGIIDPVPEGKPFCVLTDICIL